METIKCKICKCDVSVDNYALRLNNGKLTRYGKTCDDCRKKKNKIKHSTEDFKLKNKLKQKRYNDKRFFYSRATTIINRAKKRNELIPYTVNELTIFLASLWRKQNGFCVLSGDKLTRDNACVDHIITKKNKGDNSLKNLRWVTEECNQLKSGLNDEDLIKLIKKIYNKLVVN
jgi:1,4-dihydroxy-2-naphthoyl-CoA synthase